MQRSKARLRSCTSSLTRRGQVTIPISIRRRFGLKEGDQVAVAVEGDVVMLRLAGTLADHRAGILAAYRREPPLNAEDERNTTEGAIAEDDARRAGR